MESLVNRWIWSGIQKDHLRNINPVRITNILALISFSVMLLQLPTGIWFWNDGGKYAAILALIHSLFLIFVPIFNYLHLRLFAKLWLITAYNSYLCWSGLHLGTEADMHHFVLLGIFVIPFMFATKQRRFTFSFMLIMSLIFLSWELQLIPLASSDISPAYLSIITLSNSLSFALACLLCSSYIVRNVDVSWQKIAEEQQRSDQLLLNILPFSIAQKLKKSSNPIADHFENATILFADIQGFSQLAKTLSPKQLLSLLNDVFTAFDELCIKYGLEKIKTIGDEYMAVAGVPHPNSMHAKQSCLCAIEMHQRFLIICKQHRINSALRIGLNTGPVVAGVIGTSKFSYDLWGETVNLASRMESQGLAGKIQISHNTFDLVKNEFLFEPAHTLCVKGIGSTSCHFLIGTRHHDKYRPKRFSTKTLAKIPVGHSPRPA